MEQKNLPELELLRCEFCQEKSYLCFSFKGDMEGFDFNVYSSFWYLVKGAELGVAVRICTMELKISAVVTLFPSSYFYMALMSARLLLIHHGITLDSVHLILQPGTKPSVLKYTHMGRQVKGYKIFFVLCLRKQLFHWSMFKTKNNKPTENDSKNKTTNKKTKQI